MSAELPGVLMEREACAKACCFRCATRRIPDVVHVGAGMWAHPYMVEGMTTWGHQYCYSSRIWDRGREKGEKE